MEGVIFTEEQLREEVKYFLKQDAFAWDTETMDGVLPDTRAVPTQNRVVWLSMATHGRTIVVPMGHPNGDVLLQHAHTKNKVKYPLIYDAPPEQLRPSRVFDILQPLFFNPNIIKIAHNAPFDFVSVQKYFGAIPVGPISDSIVLQWLLDENIGEFGHGFKYRPMDKKLKTLAKFYYGVDYDKEDVGRTGIDKFSFSKVARYALLDAKYTWLLWKQFSYRCQEDSLDAIRALEESTTEVCCQMGLTGAPVDVQALEGLREDLTAQLEVLEAKVYRAAGKVFNINSPQQKQEILFGSKEDGFQGLEPVKVSKKTGMPSTDKETLDNYIGNKVVDAILEYMSINKILGTYVLSYLGVEGDPKKPTRIYSGRIHTDLVQYGTLTGRFSSREPNLQNIPAPRTELGTKIRGLFKAPVGYKLLVADYGQMELRILASMIGYGGLYDGFHAGIDAHTQTAALVYGVAVSEVQKWQRDVAKTLNFAIVYGAQNKKIAQTLGITVKEADKLLADHRKAFPEIYLFKDKIFKLAQSRTKIPYIRTIMGRKRRVWEALRWVAEKEAPKLPWYQTWNHPQAVRSVLARAERQVINSLVQGSLGDIIKFAMVRLNNALLEDAIKNPGKEIKLILSVHDELVLECPEDRTEEGSAMLLEAMIGKEVQDLIKVPLDVGKIAVVEKWSQAKA